MSVAGPIRESDNVDRLESAKRAEFELLASLVWQPDEVAEVRDAIGPDAFSWACNRAVYSAILRLHDQKARPTAAALFEELRASGDLADVGAQYLAELTDRANVSTNVQRCADQVASLALLGDIYGAAGETAADIEGRQGSPQELLERIQGRYDALSNRVTGTAAVSAAEVFNEVLDDIDARMKGVRRAGLPTGFATLDEDLGGGLRVGQLAVTAARPSVGKTSWALGVARNVFDQGGRVLYVSLEQTRKELVERLTAAVSGVNGHKIQTGKLSRDDLARIGAAGDVIRGWGVRCQIYDRRGLTAGQIASRVRRARREAKGLDLVIVDYLQLIAPDNARVNRNESTGAAAKRLREVAGDIGVPVLLLSQLNRMATNEVPALHHLRDSGEIEQVADVVMFLHRPNPRTPGGPDKIDLHIAKQRNGPLSAVCLEHRAETFSWSEAGGIPE